MAKRTNEPEREVTRKETHLKRRDAEANRRVMIGLIAVAAVLLILIGIGVVQELVIKPNQPVAVVDNNRIAIKDYAKRVLFSWSQSQNPVTDPQGTSVQVLDQMVDEQLIREQAAQRGITVSPDEVSEAIEHNFGYYRTPPTPAPTPSPEPSPTPGGPPTATPYPTPTPVSQQAYQTALKDYLDRIGRTSKMNEPDFRKLIEADLLRRKLFDQVSKDVPTTDEQVHARHILVMVRTPAPTPTPVPQGQLPPTPDPNAGPTPAPRDDAQALARIKEAQQKLAAGEDFAKVALEYSDDGSASSGGDLGWFGRGQMVGEFENTAFRLDPGKTSEPVKTQFGYHLIQVLEKDPARAMDQYTLQQKQYDAYNKWLTDIRAQAKIVRNWSLDKVPPTPSASSAQ